MLPRITVLESLIRLVPNPTLSPHSQMVQLEMRTFWQPFRSRTIAAQPAAQQQQQKRSLAGPKQEPPACCLARSFLRISCSSRFRGPSVVVVVAAAKCIHTRRRVGGKLRHLGTHILWAFLRPGPLYLTRSAQTNPCNAVKPLEDHHPPHRPPHNRGIRY